MIIYWAEIEYINGLILTSSLIVSSNSWREKNNLERTFPLILEFCNIGIAAQKLGSHSKAIDFPWFSIRIFPFVAPKPLDEETKFVAGKGALTDTDNFTVITDDEGVKVVIGYAEINTNRVTLPVETESYDKIENVSFNANLFRDVLVANKECESATLEVSSQGLARINFKIDEYDATYYLVADTDV